MQNFSEKVGFIWSVADLLRGDYKPTEYGRVILPFLVLRRLDQVLAGTSAAALENTSELDFDGLLAEPDRAATNLLAYVRGFSTDVRDILDRLGFEAQVARLDDANLLTLVLEKFAALDLDPYRRGPDGAPLVGPDGEPLDNVDNVEMGYIFEELIRKFSEQSNETAGEHYTPREVIRLMVTLLFADDAVAAGTVRRVYDPACGTGGMLSVAGAYLAEWAPDVELEVYGQELNAESYAICKADALIKGQRTDRIHLGNSLSEDGLPDLEADYLISNPPFGVDWSKAEKVVRAEHEEQGHAGRFGPGLPRRNDGSLLFLLHMLAKMKPEEAGGSRLAIVFNGSPLFAGGAGSGESEIRRWVIENDRLEAIVALPDQLFYNTGIATYVWVVTNRKAPNRRGRIQLINGVNAYRKMRKSLGDKRKELGDEHIRALAKLHRDFEPGPDVRIVDNEDFGFARITVERPLRLAFRVSAEGLARLEEERAWRGFALQAEVRSALASLGDRTHRSRSEFADALEAAGVAIPVAVKKAIFRAFGERDEGAEICTHRGVPEPDPELREYEDVPLTEDVEAYFAREVLPHVPDAWVDTAKTKIGYEIPFARHFSVYVAPRPPEVITEEIRELEAEVQDLLRDALG